jgi:catechol 2,3-dioxygenase-like lactoylglutathione lyase family enzyme
VYPVITIDRLDESKAFYRDILDFELTFDSDWYVSLVSREGRHQLALLDYHHPSLPENYRIPTQGMLLNFEVEDVDSLYRSLIKEKGLPLIYQLKTEEWGQRHFITVDPNGLLLDMIQLTAPSEEFFVSYSDTGKAGLPTTGNYFPRR